MSWPDPALLFQFGRWSFLAVGVAYGAMHQSRLSKKATKEREIEAKQKVIRDAKLAEEKIRNSARKLPTLDDYMDNF